MCDTCRWIDSRPREHDVCGHCRKAINRIIGTRAWFHDENGNGYCLAVKGQGVYPTDEWRMASPNRSDADRINELEGLLYMTRGEREALRIRYGEKHTQTGEHLDPERCPACAKGGVPFHDYTPTVVMFPAPASARPCPVPRCHAGMLRSASGRDEVSCPVCDGVLTPEQWRALVETHESDAFIAVSRPAAKRAP